MLRGLCQWRNENETDKMHQVCQMEIKMSTSDFILCSKIASQPISCAERMLVAKMFTANVLSEKVPRTLLHQCGQCPTAELGASEFAGEVLLGPQPSLTNWMGLGMLFNLPTP